MQKKKILIADDEEYLHKMYGKMVKGKLLDEDFEILHAYDGEETMILAKTHKPDILILDISMPQKDGRAICKELKESSDTKDIKIIMLTGKRVTQSDRLVGFEVGADDYITKPCDLEYMQLRIIRALRK